MWNATNFFGIYLTQKEIQRRKENKNREEKEDWRFYDFTNYINTISSPFMLEMSIVARTVLGGAKCTMLKKRGVR